MFLNLKKFKWIFVVGIVFLISISISCVSAMESNNYIINWDSINAGGTDNSESANYKLRDTMGQMGPGMSDSANYTMRAGYRVPNDEPAVLVFSVRAQNDSTQVSYSAFSSGSFIVTVADATGYIINDYIAVVENIGPSQMVAVGQITNVAANVITVDKWSGDQGAMSAVPAGGNDYVYEMNSDIVALDTLVPTSVSTGVALTELTTNAPNGYTIYIKEDHNLQVGIGPNDINDVADATVSAGSEEYGIETTGDNAQGANDWAITSSAQQVADSNENSVKERVSIIYKASIGNNATGGNYSHVTSYYAIVNF